MRRKDTPKVPKHPKPPHKRRPREGWDEAFAKIPELSDEERAWLEFGNEADAKLQW